MQINTDTNVYSSCKKMPLFYKNVEYWNVVGYLNFNKQFWRNMTF